VTAEEQKKKKKKTPLKKKKMNVGPAKAARWSSDVNGKAVKAKRQGVKEKGK